MNTGIKYKKKSNEHWHFHKYGIISLALLLSSDMQISGTVFYNLSIHPYLIFQIVVHGDIFSQCSPVSLPSLCFPVKHIHGGFILPSCTKTPPKTWLPQQRNKSSTGHCKTQLNMSQRGREEGHLITAKL